MLLPYSPVIVSNFLVILYAMSTWLVCVRLDYGWSAEASSLCPTPQVSS